MTTTIVQNSFLPTQIPGCKLWLDAADTSSASMTLSGTTLTTWKDKSGNGLNMTAGGNYPTYTNTGVQFNGGVPNLLSNSTGYSATTALTTFVVYQSTVAATRQRVFRTNYTGNSVLALVDTTYLDLRTKTTYKDVGPLSYSIDTANITSLVPYSATSLAYAINGTQSFSWSFSGTPTPFGSIIMVLGGEATVYFTGYIMEVIMYDAYFTDTQRQQVEGYLAWKWGIQAKLPATHLYKNTPAAIITQPTTLAVLNITNRINSASFLPPTIPGCQLWLDAADSSSMTFTSGSTTNVVTWNDKSGNGNTATSAGTANPILTQNLINGRQAISFPNTGTTPNPRYFFDGPISLTGASISYFVVCVPSSVSVMAGSPRILALAAAGAVDYTSALYLVALYQYNTGFGAYRVSGATSVTVAADTPYIFSAIATSGNVGIYQNGGTVTNITVSGTGNFSISRFRVANDMNPATNLFNGNIGEVIVYNSTITTIQRQQVEGYLAWKWGLVANLPLSHPYKAAPFTPFSAIASVASLLNTNQLNSKLISNYFNPRSITGCQIWFDGADPLGTGSAPSNATTISTWADKSGNARNATATGTPTYSAKILNGIGAPLLSGSTSYFTTPSFVPSPTGIPSIFIVMRQTSYVSGNSDFFLASNWQVIDLLGQGNAYNAVLTIGGSAQTPLTATNATLNPTLLSVIVTAGVGGVAYANGTYAATTGSSGGALASSYVYYIGSGPGFIGYIYEVMMYNSSLSTIQRQQIEGYLAWKWGIQANLPSTHPYKILPPPN